MGSGNWKEIPIGKEKSTMKGMREGNFSIMPMGKWKILP